MTYLTDKVVNGYKKGQRLRMGTCPGFVTEPSVVSIESILSRTSTTLHLCHDSEGPRLNG